MIYEEMMRLLTITCGYILLERIKGFFMNAGTDR